MNELFIYFFSYFCDFAIEEKQYFLIQVLVRTVLKIIVQQPF